MLERHLVGSFTTEKEFCEKIIFGEALRHLFLQPAIQFSLARGGKAVNFAIGATFLFDYFGLNQSRTAQALQCSINLAIARVPIAGKGTIKGLLDILTTNRERA